MFFGWRFRNKNSSSVITFLTDVAKMSFLSRNYTKHVCELRKSWVQCRAYFSVSSSFCSFQISAVYFSSVIFQGSTKSPFYRILYQHREWKHCCVGLSVGKISDRRYFSWKVPDFLRFGLLQTALDSHEVNEKINNILIAEFFDEVFL